MENQRVDYSKIIARRTADDKIKTLRAEIDRVNEILLTDAIVNMDRGGALMMKWLEEDEQRGMRAGTPRRWKLRVLRNEWGVEPPELKFIERRVMLPLKDEAGRVLRSRIINDMKRRGDFDRNFIETRKFAVDDKGCIECTFDDAGWFLQEFGKHFETGIAICGRRELSGGPCKAPDGSMKHVWYWRFEEAPSWVYDKLPVLKKKRGRKPAEKTNAPDAN